MDESCAATAVAHVAAVTGQPADQLSSSPVTLPDGTPAELVFSHHLRGGPWWLVEVTAYGMVRGILCRAVDHFDVDGSLGRMLEEYQAGRRTPYGIAPCSPTQAQAASASPEDLAGDGSNPFAGGPPATEEEKRAWEGLPMTHAGSWTPPAAPDADTTL